MFFEGCVRSKYGEAKRRDESRSTTHDLPRAEQDGTKRDKERKDGLKTLTCCRELYRFHQGGRAFPDSFKAEGLINVG